ncbi:MAG: hypothetical protein A2038_15375 [Deltaproteobacteria bacterium GWA2_57_13]|nr:MAG: hypothetical protein A2038_15375 [Deltaproteobacteria bacterium GWA2_57_13]
MARTENQMDLDQEDAFHFIVLYLREGRKSPYGSYGYELYLPNVMRDYLETVKKVPHHDTDRHLPKISPSFYAAAWELCRRGILRPGIKAFNEQATADGSSGNGYSVTPLGTEWLQKAGEYEYVPVDPGRFAKLLDNFSPRFGPGFQERCQEALRCYNAQAYLACCAMCGAAAESISLSIASAKTKNEAEILKMYSAAGGRGRIENLIIGKKDKSIQDDFRGYLSLLKYWRDIAAHGRASGINDPEAYTSLALLLRFAQFANDRWDELTLD